MDNRHPYISGSCEDFHQIVSENMQLTFWVFEVKIYNLSASLGICSPRFSCTLMNSMKFFEQIVQIANPVFQ